VLTRAFGQEATPFLPLKSLLPGFSGQVLRLKHLVFLSLIIPNTFNPLKPKICQDNGERFSPQQTDILIKIITEYPIRNAAPGEPFGMLPLRTRLILHQPLSLEKEIRITKWSCPFFWDVAPCQWTAGSRCYKKRP
jgi:hypothetical protein